MEMSATSAPRPWVRFWARIVDMTAYSGVLLVIMAILLSHPITKFPLSILIFMTWYIFAEAAVLNKFGTTLGKSLFCTTLTDKEGQRLSFSAALKRTFLVYFRGFGLGIPFLSTITLIVAYFKLKSNQITSWDRDCQTVITHQNIPQRNWYIALISILLIQFFEAKYMLHHMNYEPDAKQKRMLLLIQALQEKQKNASTTPETSPIPDDVFSNPPTSQPAVQPSVQPPQNNSTPPVQQNPTPERPSWVQDIPKNERPSWMHEVSPSTSKN